MNGLQGIYNVQKLVNAHDQLERISRRPSKKGLEGESGWSTDNSSFNCATLISNKESLWALRTEHAGPGESELSNKWCGEYQMVCRNEHMCIIKSESSRHEYETVSWEQAHVSM